MVTALLRERNSQPDYFVYYDQDTGDIASVGRSEQPNISNRLLVTNSDIARRIVAGTTQPEAYMVDFFNEQPELVTKAEFLASISNSNLRLIGDRALDVWELRLLYYTQNNKLVVEIDNDVVLRLRKYWSQSPGEQVQHTISLYVTLADDYDSLIATLELDLDELMRSKKLDFDAAKLFDGYGHDKLRFFTTAKFTRCYVDTVDEKYVSKTKSVNRNSKWQYIENDPVSHIEFFQDKDVLLVRRRGSHRANDVGQTEETLKCYITGDTPDHFITDFDIELDRILDGEQFKYQIDFDISAVNIMYNQPRLKIRKRKIK